MRDVGVDVERAVGGGEPVDADRPQPVEQQLPVGRVVMQQRIRLGDRFGCERRDGGDLRQRRRADGEVSRQAVHRALQLLRHQQPAQPPAGHREVLRKAVDHHGISRCLPRAAGGGRALVHQAVVDLVADQPDSRRVHTTTRSRPVLRAESPCRSGWPGLATITPCTGGSKSASICAVGWKRVSGPQGISTTSQPSADRMLR